MLKLFIFLKYEEGGEPADDFTGTKFSFKFMFDALLIRALNLGKAQNRGRKKSISGVRKFI
jgi:hypothetical protein